MRPPTYRAAATSDPTDPANGEAIPSSSRQVEHATAHAVDRLVARIDAYRAIAYDPATHREPITKALVALTRPYPSRQAVSLLAGQAVNALLPVPLVPFGLRHRPGRPWPDPAVWESRRRWFAGFLRDQPQWDPRLTT